jgi:ABC-2 type transport system permease protein
MSSVSVILGFLTKEFRQIGRSKEMLVVIFILPLVQLLIMGFAVTNEVKNVKIIFFDHDNSPASRQLIDAFSSTDRFRVIPAPLNAKPEDMLARWQTQVAIVIPVGFGRDLNSFRSPSIEVVSDGIDGNTAAIANSYVSQICANYIRKLLEGKDPFLMSKLGSAGSNINLITRMWFNPDLVSSWNIIPGIIAVLVTVTSMMLSAISLVKEKEIGTLEQLMVTPVTKPELLTGKLIPYLLITLVQMVVAFIFAHFIHGTRVEGSVLSLFAFSGLYFFTTLGLGIFISTMVSSQQQAMFFSWFTMVIIILLSGFFVPVQNMPKAIRVLSFFNPMSHYLTALREIMIKGTPFIDLIKEFYVLVASGAICFGFSILRFKKVA